MSVALYGFIGDTKLESWILEIAQIYTKRKGY